MSRDSRFQQLRTRCRFLIVAPPFFLVLGVLAFAAHLAGAPQENSTESTPPKPQENNSLCYVCHLDLEKEEIAAVHLKEEITCAGCHGPSYDHMHDEMLMTTPDRLYGRAQVEEMCKRCHDPHENPEKVKAFLEKWRGRDRPNGRVITETSICTDCHGLHNIAKKMGSSKADEKKPADWVAAFNGEDLSGWRQSGGSWTVQRGRIVGIPDATGKGGDLWSEQSYGNFQIAVTFQSEWPIRGGIWLRSQEEEPGFRIEIFENQEPPAFPGSVRAGKKGLALLNLRENLFDREGWNTIAAEVRGDRIRVWLNGEEIGAVRVPGPKAGKIGFHLEGGEAYRASEISVREVLIQALPEEKKET